MGDLVTTLPKQETEENKFEPYQLKDYTVIQPLTSDKSGFSKWGFCMKDGKEYFIKEFLNPVYPPQSVKLAADIRERKMEQCIAWYDEKKRVYDAIVSAQSGNLVVPVAFFKNESHFYLVTNKIVESETDFSLISKTDMKHKLIIMKVLADSFMMLADKQIIHADVKPDNLLIKQTNANFYTVKVIDFDASYLADNPPEPDDIQGDPVYYAPETFLYIAEEDVTLTTKVDVFSLGLIFHQLLCGALPEIDPEYDYIYEAVLSDAPVRLNETIEPCFRTLIEKMLEKDADTRFSMSDVMKYLEESVIEPPPPPPEENLPPPPPPPPPPPVSPEPPSIWKMADDFDI